MVYDVVHHLILTDICFFFRIGLLSSFCSIHLAFIITRWSMSFRFKSTNTLILKGQCNVPQSETNKHSNKWSTELFRSPVKDACAVNSKMKVTRRLLTKNVVGAPPIYKLTPSQRPLLIKNRSSLFMCLIRPQLQIVSLACLFSKG